MNTRLVLLIIICGFFSTMNTHAQDKTLEHIKQVNESIDLAEDPLLDEGISSKKKLQLDESLVNLMETDFMKEFEAMRIRAEGAVAAFKAVQIDYSPQDVTRVKIAYTKVANAFNKKLNDVKLDFLDKEKLKMISKFPDMYSSGIENDMRDLRNFYSQNFQLVLQEVTGGDIDGAFLPLLLGVVELASKFSNYLAKVKYRKRTITNEYMDLYFVEPNKFTHWDEILPSEGTSDSYDSWDSYDNSGEEDKDEEDSTDFLENPVVGQDTSKIDGGSKTKKKKKIDD